MYVCLGSGSGGKWENIPHQMWYIDAVCIDVHDFFRHSTAVSWLPCHVFNHRLLSLSGTPSLCTFGRP